MKFKVGDKVRCIKNTTTKRDYGGGGYRLGLEFYINEILKASTDICYGGYGGMGVFEEYLELVEEKIDFKIPGTKLPHIPADTEYRCETWGEDSKNDTLITPNKDNISFGVEIYKGEEYILADSLNPILGDNHYMFKVSEIERLAKEQGMIKEIRKELPKSFCIKQDQSNPLWKKYIAWLNEKGDYDANGKGYNYYGITKSGKFDFWNDPKHFDQIITLEQWNEIVNGKQEKQNNVEITRKQLKNIHDVACSTWKTRIEREYATRNPWGDTIEFTQKEIDEMFKAATASQKEVLEVIFGKQTKEIDLSKGKIDGLELFKPGPTHIDETMMMVRTASNLANKAFLLNADYNWEIVTDEIGCTCLVPTRK